MNLLNGELLLMLFILFFIFSTYLDANEDIYEYSLSDILEMNLSLATYNSKPIREQAGIITVNIGTCEYCARNRMDDRWRPEAVK